MFPLELEQSADFHMGNLLLVHPFVRGLYADAEQLGGFF